MARPRPVPGVKPGKPLRRNARRILRVRIGEAYGYEGLVDDPGNVAELHAMRIALKRLRYLLEIFAPAFTGDLAPFLEEIRGLQDLLGDIHDCDVQVPALEAHLLGLAAPGPGAPDLRPGIRTLIAGRRARRLELFARFRGEWRRLRDEAFRERLEAALGLRA
ncbi:MAG: CHAD domain-containing protein [Thermoleophilia bacterium]|nr:CHAD domain-containing protein [Thermoleophilia bacterium]